MECPQKYVNLHVVFDYSQITDSLYWKMLDQDGLPVEAASGLQSGLFELDCDHDFGISVLATGLPGQAELSVVDCTLVTLPMMFGLTNKPGELPGTPGTYPYPSPFFNPADSGCEPEGATVSFRTENLFTRPLGSPSWSEQHWVSGIKRTVVNAGRWDTLFTLTVAIKMEGQTYYRVFSFDPETSSSSGGTPPRPPNT